MEARRHKTMLDKTAMEKIFKFIGENVDGVEFDKLDDEFQLLMNSELNIKTEDDFDKMFVGANASIETLCYKRDGRYFINEK